MESDISLPKASVKQIIKKHINPALGSSASGITEIVTEIAQGKKKSRFY